MNNEIKTAVETLKKGGVILYPTETIWGLGCDAASVSAINRLLGIKNRPGEKGMIVLVNNPYMLEQYVVKVPEVAWQLIEVSEEPLTIVYPAARNLPAELLPEDGSIAIRITSHPLCKNIIDQLKRPLVSTSANYAGQPFPDSFGAISSEMKKVVDFSFDPRYNTPGSASPSSVIKVGLNGEIKILRK